MGARPLHTINLIESISRGDEHESEPHSLGPGDRTRPRRVRGRNDLVGKSDVEGHFNQSGINLLDHGDVNLSVFAKNFY
jgi:hypothetical protein